MIGDIVYYYVGDTRYRGTLIQLLDTEHGTKAIVLNESGRYVQMDLSKISAS